MFVDLCIMERMIVFMGTVISLMFMVMHMRVPHMLMLMQMFVKMLVGVFVLMIVAVLRKGTGSCAAPNSTAAVGLSPA